MNFRTNLNYTIIIVIVINIVIVIKLYLSGPWRSRFFELHWDIVVIWREWHSGLMYFLHNCKFISSNYLDTQSLLVTQLRYEFDIDLQFKKKGEEICRQYQANEALISSIQQDITYKRCLNLPHNINMETLSLGC